MANELEVECFKDMQDAEVNTWLIIKGRKELKVSFNNLKESGINEKEDNTKVHTLSYNSSLCRVNHYCLSNQLIPVRFENYSEAGDKNIYNNLLKIINENSKQDGC